MTVNFIWNSIFEYQKHVRLFIFFRSSFPARTSPEFPEINFCLNLAVQSSYTLNSHVKVYLDYGTIFRQNLDFKKNLSCVLSKNINIDVCNNSDKCQM